MTGTMNVPAEFLDKSHYFKHLAKEYHTPLDMVWALYKSEISEEEFYKCLETSKAAKLYGKGKENNMANNTQKSIIDAKISFRTTLIKALEDAGIGPVEIVGDCDVAFYMNVGEKKQVFTLKGSFKKNNTKLNGPRDSEDVMCDLIDGYAEKQEGRRCAAALREKEKKEKNRTIVRETQ